MGSPADYKYYVIKSPYEGIDEYVCIPWTWIVSRNGDNVVVSYPVENPSVTEQRVEDGEEISKEWKSYNSIVICPFYSYDQAKLITTKMNKLHHQQNCSNIECGDCGDYESLGSVKKTTYRSKQGAYSKQNINKPLEFVVSSKNDDRSAKKTRLKRTPQSNPETEAALKRSKVVEPAVSELTEQLCHAFQCPNENPSSEPITIADPELFTVIFTQLRNLHKSSTTNHSVIDTLLKTLIVNDKVMEEQAKLIVELRAALSSKGTTAVVEKISKTKPKKQEEQDDGDDNNDHELNKKSNRRSKIVLPPEYNENDSRWTLKHRELAPGLVELMPHTSVYINADFHCKRSAKDCISLARLLALEIFTKNALSVCSLTGCRARAYDVKGAFVRPGLDENARNAIMEFVEEYRREKGWKIQEQQSTRIKNGIRNLMKQIRMRYG